MSQTHLDLKDRVNLGSYYTPHQFVELAWNLIDSYVDPQTTIIDTACGYGDFLLNKGQSLTIGCDIDETALEIAKKTKNKAHFFHKNSLSDVSRETFSIPDQSQTLIVVGNPPYNDRTSLIRQKIKNVDINIDVDLISRDLGISFLRSYNKLTADIVCVLHPLSYLIKPTNFKQLKGFAANYKLKEGILISSSEFPESSKLTPFPIVIGLYERVDGGMEYEFIRSYPFRVRDGNSICINDFDYISNYIRKYPSKKQAPINDDTLLFWTMRDINALKRNRTFVQNYSYNAIVIDKNKLDYYIYVDVFKRNLHRLPFYFGNCDVPIDDKLFNECKHYFIIDAIKYHPYLEKHYQTALIEKKHIDSKLNVYFKKLLGEHHV